MQNSSHKASPQAQETAPFFTSKTGRLLYLRVGMRQETQASLVLGPTCLLGKRHSRLYRINLCDHFPLQPYFTLILAGFLLILEHIATLPLFPLSKSSLTLHPPKYQLALFSPSDMGLQLKTLIHIFIHQSSHSTAILKDRPYPQYLMQTIWDGPQYKVYQVFEGQCGNKKYFKCT